MAVFLECAAIIGAGAFMVYKDVRMIQGKDSDNKVKPGIIVAKKKLITKISCVRSSANESMILLANFASYSYTNFVREFFLSITTFILHATPTF